MLKLQSKITQWIIFFIFMQIAPFTLASVTGYACYLGVSQSGIYSTPDQACTSGLYQAGGCGGWRVC